MLVETTTDKDNTNTYPDNEMEGGQRTEGQSITDA